jgi:uncharacterized protein YigA (DUF484 family)
MADHETVTPLRGGPSAADVADYLGRNPEFLVNHPELLHALTPPAQQHGKGVLDFQRFVVERLQSDLARLRRAHDEVLAASRANLAAQQRINTAILAFLGATTMEQLVEVALVDLTMHLEIDTVVLGFEAVEHAPVAAPSRGLRLWPKGRIEGWIPAGKDVLLVGSVNADPALFGSASSLVKSQALMRLQLKRNAPIGLLALGARDPGKFSAGQGTELLSFLARALELSFRGWLERG